MKINIEIAEVNVNFYVDDDYQFVGVKSLRDEHDPEQEQGDYDPEKQEEIIEKGKEIIIEEMLEEIIPYLSKMIPDHIAFKAGKETETSDK